jgi:hypothetical protein
MDLARMRNRMLQDVALRHVPRMHPLVSTFTTWPASGDAMFVRCIEGLIAIDRLMDDGLERDAWALVRTLYEHIVTFAWISAAPAERLQLWMADDFGERIKAMNDMSRFGTTHDPAVRAALEEQIQSAASSKLPSLPAMAHAADEYWSTRTELHSGPKERKSFSGLYAIAYRQGSARTHSTPLGHRSLAIEQGESVLFTTGLVSKAPNPFTMTPMLFSMGALIASIALGWPSSSDIVGVFGQTSSLDEPQT